MGSLIDLEDQQSMLQKPIAASNKVFGVIKRECNAIEVTRLDEDGVEKLKLGTLIQIMPDYHGDNCHFKIRDFDNWHDKYKTTIYKCSKDDYMVVQSELWPYLMSFKNYEGRIKFVNSVYHREFNMDMLKLGRNIRIRGPHDAKINYFDFVVIYIGVVRSIGTGYYIGLKLVNSEIPLTSELKCLSRYYEWGGVGIIVPADWIMLNLYNEEEYQTKPTFKSEHEISSVTDKIGVVEIAVEVTENSLDNFCGPIEEPKKKNELVLPNTLGGTSQNLFGSTYSTFKMPYIQSFESIKNSPENVAPKKLTSETGAIPKIPQLPPTKYEVSSVTDKIGVVEHAVDVTENSLDNFCGPIEPKKISELVLPDTLGGTSQNLFGSTYSTFKMPCIQSFESIKNSSENVAPKKLTSETGAIQKIPQLPPTKYDDNFNNQLNHTVEIEELNNVEGSVKNTEHTKCDLCDKILGIGLGIILRECLHSFCEECIRSHVKRNKEHSGISCPYNKQYECQSDLVDVEIKHLGGELVYNKILDNRLNEYVRTDPNVRMCPNESCREVWVISQTTHTNFERCRKCGESWCNICNSPHEPQDRHGGKQDKSTPQKMADWISKTVFRKEPAEPILACVKCHKSNIPKSECVTLQNCKHTFCRDCVVPMIKTQASGSQFANCIICKKRLYDKEVTEITGLDVLEMFRDSRIKQSAKTNIQTEKYSSTPSSKQVHVADKCLRCDQPSDVQLEKCRHSFCRKCIRESISNQALDQTKLCINCFACDDAIVDSDISRYGGEEIFTTFKSKFEAAAVISKRIDHITLNDRPFNCLFCEEQFLVKQGVMFAGCSHTFCLGCCKEFIGMQLLASQIPKCIFCQMVLEQFEVDELTDNTTSVTNCSQILVECLKCEEKFQENLIQKCSKCANPICLKCAHSTILGQLKNSRTPNCLFCQLLLDESLITSITNRFLVQPEGQISGIVEMKDKPEQKINQFHLKNSHPVNISFECSVCDQSTVEACQIQLSKCKHEICRNCLQEKISNQMTWSREPKCPICNENIERSELNEIGISIINKVVTEPIQHSEVIMETTRSFFGKTNELPRIAEQSSSAVSHVELNRELNTSLRLNNAAFECTICDNTIDPGCGVMLANCEHSLCRNCISEVILQQCENQLAPKCPLCQTLITDDEFRILVPGVHNIFLENQLDHNSSAEPAEFENLTQDAMVLGVDELFVCCICDEEVVPNVMKVLTHCHDKFCRPCITKVLKDQTFINKTPKCPMCCEEVAGADIIDLCGSDVFKRYAVVGVDEMFICYICEDTFELNVMKVLTHCRDKFCRPCIAKALNDQSFINKIPTCPVCCKEVAGADINDLCGFDGFKRYMDNKRNK